MKVVSLMAGVSSRLKPLTDSCHKVLLDISGKSLIERQLEAFKRFGITEAVFVVGYKADAVRQAVGEEYKGVRITYIYNPYYSTRNINYSLYLAKDKVAGEDFIYMEADLLFDPELLGMVMRSGAGNCVIADSGMKSAKVDTLVLGSEGKVTGLLFKEHGDLKDYVGIRQDIAGELILVVKFCAKSSFVLFDELERGSFDGRVTLYSIFEKCFKACDTHYLLSGSRPWVEVDNHEDLKMARDIIGPKIDRELKA